MNKTINQYINQLHLDPKKEAAVRKLVANTGGGGGSSKKLPKNGIYIYDIYGDFTLFKDFSPSKSDTALGVALIDDKSVLLKIYRNAYSSFGCNQLNKRDREILASIQERVRQDTSLLRDLEDILNG